MKIRLLFVPGLLLALSSGSPSATVNFAGLTQAGSGFHSQGTTYSQDGFTFAVTGGPFGTELGAFQSASVDHPLGGAAATSLLSYFAGSTMTITSASGVFDLFSIDMAQYGANQGGGSGSFSQTLTGVLFAGGTVSQTLTITRGASPALSTFPLIGFEGLTSVSFLQGTFAAGEGVQFNNLVTTPEPGSGLLVMGVLLLGAWRWRVAST